MLKLSSCCLVALFMLFGIPAAKAFGVIVGGGSGTTTVCDQCKCTMASGSAECVQKWSADITCYQRIRTLSNSGECFNAVDKLSMDRIQPPGVYERRADCCADWTVIPFNAVVGEYVVLQLGKSIYQKNHTTGLWMPNVPFPSPPMNEFPGLGAAMTSMSRRVMYDNTTCKDRCCVLGLVDRAKFIASGATCENDWSQCVELGFDNSGGQFPLCSSPGAKSTPLCTVWVPCSSGQEWVIESCIAAVLLVAISAAVVVYRKYYVVGGLESVELWYTVLGFLNLGVLILTLITALRYIHWAESTEVDSGYISYQGCVAECNSRANSADAVLRRYCADNYTSVQMQKWAVWEEDHNALLSDFIEDVCNTGDYCSSCESKTDEFDSVLRLAWFLRVRPYLGWLAFCVVVGFSHPIAWIIGAVFHLAFWITASAFVDVVQHMAGAMNQLEKDYSSMGSDIVFPSLFNMCIACVVLDVFFFLMLVCMTGCVDRRIRRGEQVAAPSVTSTVTPATDGLGCVRIEPRYTKLPISLSTFL